ncbi:MAG: spermidine/putrescine ABC transporter substrate-binding protein [Gammaproteobacteria bacterium]|nr:spermidine/putrescine ABC transporter substrate-binding protein [Gammaproteobacteria bacterium]
MISFFRLASIILVCIFVPTVFAAENIVNVYTWADEIPRSIITQFEKETGIKVNYSTFDSNEIMYSKIRAMKHTHYDLVEPSSYYIARMHHQNFLEKLDKTKLPNFKNIDPAFLNKAYDPQNEYSIPFIWGITGIFLNKAYFPSAKTLQWKDLNDKKYLNQLMFLDDAKEVFSIALRMLGYSINDENPDHIRLAYLKLKTLMPNIKLFNSDAIISLLIDEDAAAGMAWNGDLFKASCENTKLQFIYPKDGFEIWVDNFAILKNAPHPENAYKFLNFLMRADVAKTASLSVNYSTANLAARNLMPPEIKNNSTLYPSAAILKNGEFQTDIDEKSYALLEKYWEQLKMGG